MRSTPEGHTRALFAILLIAILVGTLFVAGCTRSASTPASDLASAETTPGEFPARPHKVSPPPPPMLRDPRTAAYSYLLWISYAYRMLNSEVASPTFSPYEEVRVDSYVQYNRQEKRALDQRLLVAKVKSSESKGSTATVAMSEQWAYRYIDITTAQYKTPTLYASYDTTYTLVKLPRGWVVDSVVATSVAGSIK